MFINRNYYGYSRKRIVLWPMDIGQEREKYKLREKAKIWNVIQKK